VSINERVGVGFLVAVGLACTVCLFIPGLGDDQIGRGIFRVLPGGSLFVAGIVASAALIAVVITNSRRRRKGKPPV
jgi:hypothetical protein